MSRTTPHPVDAELLDAIERDSDIPVGSPLDGAVLRQLGRAVDARVDAEATIRSAVTQARADGHSWATIGAVLGVSRQAAIKRFGP